MATVTKKVKKKVVEHEVVAHRCDCCKKEWTPADWINSQEMLRWRGTGGYGSVFGDGAQLSLDLCQDCAKKLLGDYIQVDASNAY